MIPPGCENSEQSFTPLFKIGGTGTRVVLARNRQQTGFGTFSAGDEADLAYRRFTWTNTMEETLQSSPMQADGARSGTWKKTMLLGR